MALHKVAIAAKDGNTTPTAIPGGIEMHDLSGAGTGPFVPLPVAIDSAGNEIQGLTTDAAATQTDATAVSAHSVRKQISASIQVLAGAISSAKMAVKAAAADFADGAITTLGLKADAASTATDTTSITIMSVLKQISKSVQGTLTVASHAVTNAGTFAVQATIAAGSAVIGKVSIDQTTDLTTNKVRAFIHDGTTALTILAASSGPPAATVPAIPVSIRDVNANGRNTPANSAPVVLNSMTYKPVAVSQTAALLGATGASGDYLDGILIIPAAAAAGAVSITDGSGSAITIFAGGGTTALPTLAPFFVPIGAISSGGAGGWKVTTGASVSVIGVGNFT